MACVSSWTGLTFATEEQAIKARLRSKETILEKAVRKFVTFTKQPDPAEAYASNRQSVCLRSRSMRLYYSLMGEMEKYELDMSKTQMVFSSNLQEVASYQHMSEQRTKEIEHTRSGIEGLKKDLEKARLHRKHLEEYDQLARMINTLPTRQTTDLYALSAPLGVEHRRCSLLCSEIMELNKDIEALEREAEAISGKIEMRGKQFQLLLYSLHELHAELYDEEQEENERAAKRAREEEEAKARVEAESAEVVLLDVGDRDAENVEREDRAQAARTEARAASEAPKEEEGEVEEGAVEPMDASGV